ncbi:MAG: lipoyl protein ligase domain-containing protein [Acidimicrobiales bacterium]
MVEADGPALVLGSTQRPEIADVRAADAAGVVVVRRRSGGGAVLVGTADVVWADVFVPAGDLLWERDVSRATHWLGAAWTDALAGLGAATTWHDGALVAGPWSDLVCFAGMGPGEVRSDRAKMVGISQRRTRDGALFQCAALLAWDPAPTLGLLALSTGERRQAAHDLAGVAAGIGYTVTAAALQDVFVASVATR